MIWSSNAVTAGDMDKAAQEGYSILEGNKTYVSHFILKFQHNVDVNYLQDDTALPPGKKNLDVAATFSRLD